MSNPLVTFQSDAKAAIEASSYFAGISVFNDDGTVAQQCEAALEESGVCIVVQVPGGFNARQQVRDVVDGTVTGGVELWLNPLKNAERATPLVINEALSELIVALAGSPNDSARRGFQIDSVSFEADDVGLWCYLVMVTRPATIKAS